MSGLISQIKDSAGNALSFATLGLDTPVRGITLRPVYPVTYKTGRMLAPIHVRTDSGSYTFRMETYVRATTPAALFERVAGLSAVLEKCTFVLAEQAGKLYECVLINTVLIPVSSLCSHLQFDFDCEVYSAEATVTISSATPITIAGARATDLRLEIKALTELTDFVVLGITIKTLASGKTLIINNPLITVDGANAYAQVDMLLFPQAVGALAVTATNYTSAEIKVKYKARW